MPPTITLTHPSGASAQIQKLGANVTSWRDATGRERLFPAGIPVIFPQFADTGPLPMHGVVQTHHWDIVEHDTHRVLLRTTDSAATRKLWPHPFVADLAVILDDLLTVGLRITNTGVNPFTFTAGFHTYFAVDDITTARIVGLENVHYRDKLQSFRRILDSEPSLTITDHTDRVYENAPSHLILQSPTPLHIDLQNFTDWVIWNPWTKMHLPDLQPDDYKRFVCIESVRVSQPVTLEPDAEWTGLMALDATVDPT
jgi:glucose-6-phosphate 1-epimerase